MVNTQGNFQSYPKAANPTFEPQAFAAFSGTMSPPFHCGETIKVIDSRGSAVMRVHNLKASVP